MNPTYGILIGDEKLEFWKTAPVYEIPIKVGA